MGTAKEQIHFLNLTIDWAMLPYQWGILRAFAETDPDITAAYEFAEPLYLVSQRDRWASKMERPAVLAASCYAWNFRLQMKLMREAKRAWPECLTVVGGPHIPDAPRDFFREHPYVDVMVHGEGEIPFRDLLKARLAGRPALETVSSISINKNGDALTTGGPSNALAKELDDVLPSPYLLGYFDPMIADLERAQGVEMLTLWETNRGCPYACTFCEWGAAALSKVKRIGTERLKQEIDWFSTKKIGAIFCADANFGILARDEELADYLAATKLATGYPRMFNSNFAKNSNDRVFRISKALASAKLCRGTSLAMQSTDLEVLEAVKRSNIGIERYKELKERYNREQIPTYTDLILGLPKETRETWMRGIAELLETGHHENVRCFELAILPNTPMQSDVETYGLKMTRKLISGLLPPDEAGEVDIVYETNTMSFDDYVDCRVYFDVFMAACQNGVYTRYLSMFLARSGILGYRAFYDKLFARAKAQPDSVLGRIVRKMSNMMRVYFASPDQPQHAQVLAQPEMRGEVERFISPRYKHRWYTRDWPWFVIALERDRFYEEVSSVLAEAGVLDATIRDLIHFQKELMLDVSYDPAKGKSITCTVSWPRYFFGDGAFRRAPTTIRFTDERMGVAFDDLLVPGDAARFAKTATGIYFVDGTHRRFCHQSDCMYYREGEAEELPAEHGCARDVEPAPRRLPVVAS